MRLSEAFKELEVAVREKAGFDHSKYGTDMMRQAFAPNNGALADRCLPTSEQDSMSSLMAGAIGLFRIPDHPSDNVDISEADKAYQLVIMEASDWEALLTS